MLLCTAMWTCKVHMLQCMQINIFPIILNLKVVNYLADTNLETDPLQLKINTMAKAHNESNQLLTIDT